MIHILDQKTIDKIAAGEVIERPASIVKELVENSVDAGASRVTVEIRDGGISMIRVTDNGCGIEAEEVRKAFLRHATSKLRDAADLVGVETLGFRGEALSTISAVTQTEMITKTHEALTGIKYVIHGGTEMECAEIGAPDGTTIVSRNIFYNTPARLKFLKTAMTEGSYISDLMSHIALSHPEVSVKLISNGKTIVDTAGNGSLKDTIYTLYGRDVTGALLPVEYADGGLKVTGFIGKPFLARGNRSFENYFVNGRYIKSPVINRAIEEAYKTYIMQHRFPFTVLYLELPGEECDVNVHPTKREFKYQNEKALFSVVFHAVHETLEKNAHIPDMTRDYGTKESIYRGNPDLMREKENPYGRKNTGSSGRPMSGIDARPERDSRVHSVNPGNVTGQSSSGFRIADDGGTPSADSGSFISGAEHGNGTGISSAEQAGSPGADASGSQPVNPMASTPGSSPVKSPEASSGVKSGSHPTGGSGFSTDPIFDRGQKKSGNPGSSYQILEALMPKDFRDRLKEQEKELKQAEEAEARREEEEERQRNISFRQAELTDEQYLSAEAEPEIQVIGLLFNTYWISQYKDNLYLMDQHAAHEKVNYERFLAEFRTRSIHSQRIFPPKLITLSGADKEAVLSSLPMLERMGFEIEDFGGNEVRLNALPANLLGLSGEDVFMEMAAYLSSGIEGVTEDIFVRKLATMGCKAAVKGNQRISVSEVQALMKELLSLDNPYTCPHGRPTIIRMTKEELDRRFKRIVD